MVFYTDGVTEAQNLLAEEFGMERLSAVVQRGSSLSAEELMDRNLQKRGKFLLKTSAFAMMSPFSWSNANFNGPPACCIISSTRSKLLSRGGLERSERGSDSCHFCSGSSSAQLKDMLSVYWHPVHCAGLFARRHLPP